MSRPWDNLTKLLDYNDIKILSFENDHVDVHCQVKEFHRIKQEGICQGKIFLMEATVVLRTTPPRPPATTTVVLKVTPIYPTQLWYMYRCACIKGTDIKNELKLQKELLTYQNEHVNVAYVDAVASCVTSQWVCDGKTPFHPIVFGAYHIASARSYFTRPVDRKHNDYTLVSDRDAMNRCGGADCLGRRFQCVAVAMQQLDGSLEDLMRGKWFYHKENTGELTLDGKRLCATVFQIVFGLAQMQQQADMVHNDLHAANIMYEDVDERNHLYYRSASGRFFAVPTYGKVFKAIDYGRATFVHNQKHYTSQFWEDTKVKLNPHNQCTDLIRLVYEFDYVLNKVAINVLNPYQIFIHRMFQRWTTTVHGDTLASRARQLKQYVQTHSTTTNQVRDFEVDAYVWMPMLESEPCRNAVPSQQVDDFFQFFGVRESAIPDGVTVYRLEP